MRILPAGKPRQAVRAGAAFAVLRIVQASLLYRELSRFGTGLGSKQLRSERTPV
ncbi:MAG TPA: hypothetical protein VGG20_03295 [Thermoanaerobaculia bacterium]